MHSSLPLHLIFTSFFSSQRNEGGKKKTSPSPQLPPLPSKLPGLRRQRTRAYEGSPGGQVVKKQSSNAGVAGLIPGQGTKIPHAEGN